MFSSTAARVDTPVHYTLSYESWTGVVIVDIENSDDFLYESRDLPPIPLTVDVGSNGDKLKWKVSLESTPEGKLAFWFEFIDGPQEKENCKVKVEVSAPGIGILATKSCRSTEVARKNIYKIADISESEWRKTNNGISQGVRRISIELTVIRESKLQEGASWAFLADQILPKNKQPESDSWTAKFFNNPLHSDLTIKCGEVTFPAHKIILDRNPVFAQHIEASGTTNEIFLDNVSPSTLEQILQSIYSVQLSLPSKPTQVFRILMSADYFKIPELEALCIQHLIKMTTDDNVGEINLAVQKYCSNSKAQLIFKNYCRRNHARLIQNEEYRSFYYDNIDAF